MPKPTKKTTTITKKLTQILPESAGNERQGRALPAAKESAAPAQEGGSPARLAGVAGASERLLN